MSLTGSCFSSESAPVALPSWDSKTRWNNLLGGLAVRRTAGPSGHANSPHPSSREGHHSTGTAKSGSSEVFRSNAQRARHGPSDAELTKGRPSVSRLPSKILTVRLHHAAHRSTERDAPWQPPPSAPGRRLRRHQSKTTQRPTLWSPNSAPSWRRNACCRPQRRRNRTRRRARNAFGQSKRGATGSRAALDFGDTYSPLAPGPGIPLWRWLRTTG
jgi:hypothetical protein